MLEIDFALSRRYPFVASGKLRNQHVLLRVDDYGDAMFSLYQITNKAIEAVVKIQAFSTKGSYHATFERRSIMQRYDIEIHSDVCTRMDSFVEK